jgi:nucleoside-triphosphatase THEP1
VLSGKSLFVERIVGALRCEGFAISGFLQRGVFGADGRKVGHDLVGISSGSCLPLARRSEPGEGWRFEDDAFEAAVGEVRVGADLVVIDEVGHLELAGKGHAAAVERALSSSAAVLIVVREALAEDATRWLSPRADVNRVRFEPGEEEKILSEIRALLTPGKT